MVDIEENTSVKRILTFLLFHLLQWYHAYKACRCHCSLFLKDRSFCGTSTCIQSHKWSELLVLVDSS